MGGGGGRGRARGLLRAGEAGGLAAAAGAQGAAALRGRRARGAPAAPAAPAAGAPPGAAPPPPPPPAGGLGGAAVTAPLLLAGACSAALRRAGDGAAGAAPAPRSSSADPLSRPLRGAEARLERAERQQELTHRKLARVAVKLRVTRRGTRKALEELEAGAGELAGAAEAAARGQHRAALRLDALEDAVTSVQEALARQVDLLGRLSKVQAELRCDLEMAGQERDAGGAPPRGGGGEEAGGRAVQGGAPQARASADALAQAAPPEPEGAGGSATPTSPDEVPGGLPGGTPARLSKGPIQAAEGAPSFGSAQARALDRRSTSCDTWRDGDSVVFRFD